MIKIKDIKRLYERENKVSSDFGHFLTTQAEKLKVTQIFRDAIGSKSLVLVSMSLARKPRIEVNHFGVFVRLQCDVGFWFFNNKKRL